jgi:hypothetical protein
MNANMSTTKISYNEYISVAFLIHFVFVYFSGIVPKVIGEVLLIFMSNFTKKKINRKRALFFAESI